MEIQQKVNVLKPQEMTEEPKWVILLKRLIEKSKERECDYQ